MNTKLKRLKDFLEDGEALKDCGIYEQNVVESLHAAADSGNTNDLMTALDNAGFESDQSWDDESTTWTITDDFQITIDSFNYIR